MNPLLSIVSCLYLSIVYFTDFQDSYKRNGCRVEVALLHVNPPLSFYRAHSVEDTESETFDFILKDNVSGFMEVIIRFSLNPKVCSSRS